jgi:hypothetical protein
MSTRLCYHRRPEPARSDQDSTKALADRLNIISALLRRWQRSATSRRVMVERLRHANFCLNIGPAFRNGDTTAARRAQRGGTPN